MSEDKRTYEARAPQNQGLRSQFRQVKGLEQSNALALEGVTGELSKGDPMPISPDLILRLIKLLEES